MGTLLALLAASSVHGQSVSIDIDTRGAERLLEIACSGAEVDPAEFSGSELLRNQLAHHRRFGERYNMDNYIAGVRAIAACEAPDPDPFRFSSLVQRRAEMEAAISYLAARRERIGEEVARLLRPYMPAAMSFEGHAVLAGASFSCGGFAQGGAFFVDIPCIAADIEGEYEAVVKLIAHETYHAIQGRFAPDASVDLSRVSSVEEALDNLFTDLALEGTASHVADMRDIAGDGRYASFSRSLARRNFSHLRYDFRLLDYLIEALVREPLRVAERAPGIIGLAFDGAYDEHGYFVGQQMAAEIEHSFGAAAIPCVLALPPESYVLLYDAALQDGDDLEQSSPFAASTVEAARWLAGRRATAPGFSACTG
jgi:hypothetical protein